MSRSDEERQEWIRRSTQERSFLESFTGAPHPASLGKKSSPRRPNRILVAVVSVIAVTFGIQLIQSLVSIFTVG
ncbi:MAG TPA: hypothetical protein VHJ78_08655 [Actinomycetota bacterium]|nr:hypothetical protein [Actinomycetota bacterium]